MITTITTILSYIFFCRKRGAVTKFFLLAFLIKVVVPMYYYNKNIGLTLQADILAALSTFIIVITSVVYFQQEHGSNLAYTTEVNFSKKYFLVALILLPVLWIVFWVPSLGESLPLPLTEAIFNSHTNAQTLRIFLTKESSLGVLAEIVGKVIFPLVFLVFGLSIKKLNPLEKFWSFLLGILTIVVSFSYFQKGIPFTLILMFVVGLALAKSMTRFSWVLMGISCAILLLLVSRLYVSDFSHAFLKFQDLFFRRLGLVPIKVYEAYLSYGQEYGPLFLKHNFILNKSGESQALPMIIYQYMKYGHSNVGWANGYFVGDAYVNFGVFGVLATSFVVGLVVRAGNYFVRANDIDVFYIIGSICLMSFCFVLPGNAFYGFSVQFFMFLFFICFIASRISVSKSGGFLYKANNVVYRISWL